MPEVDDVIVRLRGEAAGALGAANQVAAAFAALRVAAGPIAGIFAAISTTAIATAAAMYGLARQAATYGEQLHNDAQKYGQQVETLAALRYAAAQANVGYGELTVGLKILSRHIEAAVHGSTEQAGAFFRLGVSAEDASGRARPLNDLLLDIADKFKALPDGTEKTALAIQLFGRAGSQLIPLLNEGSAGLRKFREEAEHLGLIISKQQAAAADTFNDSVERMKMRVTGLQITIGNELIPMFQKLIDWLEKKLPSAADAFAEAMQRARQAASGAAYGAVQYGAAGAVAGGMLGSLGGPGPGTVAGAAFGGAVGVGYGAGVGAYRGATGALPEEFVAAHQLEQLEKAKQKWVEIKRLADARLAAETEIGVQQTLQRIKASEIVQFAQQTFFWTKQQADIISAMNARLSDQISLHQSSVAALKQLDQDEFLDNLNKQATVEDKIRLIKLGQLNITSQMEGGERAEALGRLLNVAQMLKGGEAAEDVQRLITLLRDDLRVTLEKDKKASEENIGAIRDVLRDGIVAADELNQALKALQRVGPIPIEITGLKEALAALAALGLAGPQGETTTAYVEASKALLAVSKPPTGPFGAGSQVITPGGEGQWSESMGAYGLRQPVAVQPRLNVTVNVGGEDVASVVKDEQHNMDVMRLGAE